MKKYFLLFLFLFLAQKAFVQTNDSIVIRNIYSEALTSYTAYNNLMHLCKDIGGRLTGSANAEKAVLWVYEILNTMNLDSVYLQDATVRNWERGEKEIGYAQSSVLGKRDFPVCALGCSAGTGDEGINANVLEVQTFDELKELGKEKIEGKIIFFNRPADQKYINTGNGYGSAVNQRVRGAMEAAKYGAVGVIVRSATVSHDDFPHTGIVRYTDTLSKIPAVGISTNGADTLSTLLKQDADLRFYFRTTCKQNEDVKSNNVIGEIKGSEHPEEIIVVGGHLDSWDLGEGAHDDGAGIVQSIEVLRIFKTLDISPKHTIRFVAFMDEEIDQKGGRKYANDIIEKKEKHIAAIESDAGGFTPYGFSFTASDEQSNKIKFWKQLFAPYYLFYFETGGSGVDISYLKDTGTPLIGLVTDSQRYFDVHHCGKDVFETINRRELQLGSAAIASLVYLIDTYGL